MPRHSSPLRTCALAIAASFVVASVAIGARREVERADLEADGRDLVDVGAHAQLVLEPGARISLVRSTGVLPADRITVEQRAGRVLYRVDDDASIAVHTHFGSAVARAASFVVDTDPLRVAVFDGSAEIVADEASLVVPAREIADVDASAIRVHELFASLDAGETLADLEARLVRLRAIRGALAGEPR